MSGFARLATLRRLQQKDAMPAIDRSALNSRLAACCPESRGFACAGCAVVVSQSRTCTKILAFEGEGHVEWFEGNFEDFGADKIGRLEPDAVEPKRIKNKKFAR